MSWSDDKELSLGADTIGWNSLKKKKKKEREKKGSLMPFIKLKINFILFEVLGPNSFQAPKGPAVYKSHRLDHAQ